MTSLGVGFIGGPRGYTPKLVRSDYNFGADTGAQAAYTVFTVTGEVLIHALFGVCKASLTSGGAATIELGVSGNTAVFVAQTTATDLITNEIWIDASPTTTVEQIDLTSRSFVITANQDIDFLIGGADLTAGTVNFYCVWSPLSTDGALVAN
jgi:hypothetical protein